MKFKPNATAILRFTSTYIDAALRVANTGTEAERKAAVILLEAWSGLCEQIDRGLMSSFEITENIIAITRYAAIVYRRRWKEDECGFKGRCSIIFELLSEAFFQKGD